jgi:hypothetical protein
MSCTLAKTIKTQVKRTQYMCVSAAIDNNYRRLSPILCVEFFGCDPVMLRRALEILQSNDKVRTYSSKASMDVVS